MRPTVYVGIPTRNRPHYLREALHSVLAQTYTQLRVLVTDNDSSPEHAAAVRDMVAALGDPRVAYVCNPVPDGERGQTLYNFSRCEEPLFMLVHDDDRLQPTLIERAVEVLEAQPGLAFFATGQHLIDELGVPLPEESARYHESLGRHNLPGGVIRNVLEVILTAGAFSMSGTVFRRDIMARVGFVDADGGGFPIDVITYLRIGEAGYDGYFAPEHLIDYRWHAGQSSVKHGDWPFTEWMIEKYVTQLEARRYRGRAERLRRTCLSLALCRLAIVRHVGGAQAAARALFRRAIVVSPATWQGWGYCAIGHVLPFMIARQWGARVKLKRDQT